MATDAEMYRFHYMNVRVSKAAKQLSEAAAKHLDNDNAILLDVTCYEQDDGLPKHLPALGEIIVLEDTGTDLDGELATVIGYRTRLEMEGG